MIYLGYMRAWARESLYVFYIFAINNDEALDNTGLIYVFVTVRLFDSWIFILQNTFLGRFPNLIGKRYHLIYFWN